MPRANPICALSVRDVASKFGVSVHAVLAWIAVGDLRAVNVGTSPRGRRPTWRITAEAIRDFEDSRSRKPTARPARAVRPQKPKDVIAFY